MSAPGDSLPNERTALSWTRTGIALFGLAAIVLRLRFDRPSVLAVVTIVLCGGLAIAVLAGSVRRYRAAHLHQPGGRLPTDGKLPLLTVVLIVLIAIVALVEVVD